LQGNKEPGAPGTGLIRVERVRLADSGGENHLKMQLKSALYLGERWEYVLQLGELRLRVWGEEARAPVTTRGVVVRADSGTASFRYALNQPT